MQSPPLKLSDAELDCRFRRLRGPSRRTCGMNFCKRSPTLSLAKA